MATPLWPGAGDERARALLSASLYVARKALGEQRVLPSGDGLRLDPAVVRADLAAFEEHVGRVGRAVGVPGADPPAADEREDFVAPLPQTHRNRGNQATPGRWPRAGPLSGRPARGHRVRPGVLDVSTTSPRCGRISANSLVAAMLITGARAPPSGRPRGRPSSVLHPRPEAFIYLEHGDTRLHGEGQRRPAHVPHVAPVGAHGVDPVRAIA